jgi:hypothetical protein
MDQVLLYHRGQGISIGDPNKFLRDLLKRFRVQLAGIGLDALVTFDEERGNRRGKYTRLEIIFQKLNWAHMPIICLNAHK